jgi:uncharacterized membrane protein YhaH (DUF805 family)
MKWYLKCLKQYADFSGRARRTEYWMFGLFNLIFSSIAILLDTLLGSIFVFQSLYMLGVFIPGLAVTVRRLHDTGRGGGWLFIAFVPLAGAIWLLVLMSIDSEIDNRFGENPKK